MSNVVAFYLYCDAHGTPLARIDRVEPGWRGRSKEFLPYTSDGNGGFVDRPGLNGLKLPLYHVHEVRAAIDAGQAVYFTEGEGKCDVLRATLRNAGCAAAVTTIQGGASAPMRPEHIASLADSRRVIVLTDSDDPGRCAARSRAQHFADADPGCDVRIVDLYAERNDGSDVADWLADAHTLAELYALTDAAARVEQSPMAGRNPAGPSLAKRDSRPTFVRAGELLARTEAELEFAVEGLLPLGGTAVLAGRPKGGKSTLALNLALSVARGEPFLGRKTRRGPVLYLALEGAPRGWKDVLRRLGVTNDDNLLICIARAPEAAMAWLAEEIEKHRPVLVIVDTMQRLLRVKDGNDYATGSNATDAVIELARQASASLLMLHHAGKVHRAEIVDEVMGSTAWAAAVDTVLVLRRSERFRTLASEQRFGDNLPETVLTMEPETHRIEGAGPRADADREVVREAIVAFLGEYADAHPGQPFTEEPKIFDGVEGRTKAKREALRAAAAAGEIERIGTGKKGDPYRYGVSCSLVPDYVEEQENENPKTAKNGDKIRTVSCSRDSESSGYPGDENPRVGDKHSGPPREDVQGAPGASSEGVVETAAESTNDLFLYAATVLFADGTPFLAEKP